MKSSVFATPDGFVRELERRLGGTGPAERARRRQRLVFDRFLARISRIFGELLTLKGELVLAIRVEPAPLPRDVQLALGAEARAVFAKLREAARLDLSDFMSFEVQRSAGQSDDEDTPWREQSFRVVPKLAGKAYGRAFGVELTLDEPSSGEPELVLADDVLDFAGIEPATLRLYPIGAHIAETLHAYTLPRTHPRASVRDLPTLALLGTAQTLDAKLLREALEGTFTRRATHPLPSHVPEPPTAWAYGYAAFSREERLPWPTLSAVTDAVRRFLDPVLSGELDATWDPETSSFQPN